MNMSELISKLMSEGCVVQHVPNDPNLIHVDGYHPPECKGLPDWIWHCAGWAVSTCGFSRVFMFKLQNTTVG